MKIFAAITTFIAAATSVSVKPFFTHERVILVFEPSVFKKYEEYFIT